MNALLKEGSAAKILLSKEPALRQHLGHSIDFWEKLQSMHDHSGENLDLSILFLADEFLEVASALLEHFPEAFS